MKIKNRSEIPNEYKWDIERMYPSEDLVAKDLESGMEYAEAFEAMRGTIMDSAANLLKAIELYMNANRKIEKAFVYSRQRKDEDNSDSKYDEMCSKAVSVISAASAKMAYFVPELLESSEELLDKYLEDEPELATYEFMLRETFMQKKHTLSSEQEYIMATLSEVLGSAHEIFTALNNADLTFGTVVNDEGKEIEVSHANFTQLLQSANREVRKATYEALYSKYKEHNNTLATAYNNNVKTTKIKADLRSYESSLDAALSGDHIPEAVYYNLIKAVHEHLPAMYKYVALRKKALGVDELKMYDVYKPLVKPTDIKYTFEEAVDICCKALAPMGEEYVDVFRKGILEEKWVDVYENKGKTSGAYSFGSYDSLPYILMNFSGELNDVFTLIHEGGHSMHSYYTRKNQPYVYGDHSIFTAEVASTVNETLLIKYLLKDCNDEDMRAYLINFYIDEFKSTLFRQTMFAEFELKAHEYVENGGSLTTDYLNKTYDALNTLYFGDAMSHDEMIQYEWSRIPHLYRDFYVYQYATGYSAANALASKILDEGQAAVDNYIEFLCSGSSKSPIDLLKIAGVDMSTEEPVLSALDTFDELVDQLEGILK